MPEVTVSWSETNTDEDGHKIYRSTSNIDPSSPPSPLATVAAGTNTYSDTTVSAGVNYYRVAAYRGADLAFSTESTITVELTGDYDLPNSTTISVTPKCHFDASAMDGTNNDDWSDADTVSQSAGNLWIDRTNQIALRGPSTSAAQPIFVDSHTLLNSKPAVELELQEAFFWETDNSAAKTLELSSTDGWQCFLVMSTDSSSNAQFLNADISENGGTGNYRFQLTYGTSGRARAYGDAPDPCNIYDAFASCIGKRWLLNMQSTASSGSSVRTKRNGDSSFEVGTDPDDAGGLKWENMNDTSDSLRFKGHIAEMLWFDESLDSDDVDFVEDYLTTKYSI